MMENDLLVNRMKELTLKPLLKNDPAFDKSGVSNYIESNVSSNYSIFSLFNDILNAHIENKRNYYLHPRKVVVPQKANDLNILEKIQLAKNIISHIFSANDIESIASGAFTADQLLIYQKHVLVHSICHIQTLIDNPDVYKTSDEQEQLIMMFIKYLTRNDSRYVQSLSLPLSKNKSATLVNTKYFINQEPAEDGINITTYQQAKSKVGLQNAAFKPLLFSYFDHTATQTELIIDALEQYPKNLSFEDATSICQMIASGSTAFIKDYFAAIPAKEKVSNIQSYFDDIITIYQSNNKHMKLLKYLALCELNRTGKSNEMFRQNNNFIRCLLYYITHVSTQFISECVPQLNQLVVDSKAWSYDHPSEEDLETVRKLLSDFWARFIECIPKIPGSVRMILRCIRENSEFMFREKSLNNRACFAIFLLRFLFIQMTDPIATRLKSTSLAKVIQFTKLFAFAGQMSLMKLEQKGDRLKFNPILEESFADGEKFYETLIQKTEIEKCQITNNELIQAVQNLRSFVIENKDILLQSSKDSKYSTNFLVVEGVCEFLSSMKP